MTRSHKVRAKISWHCDRNFELLFLNDDDDDEDDDDEIAYFTVRWKKTRKLVYSTAPKHEPIIYNLLWIHSFRAECMYRVI